MFEKDGAGLVVDLFADTEYARMNILIVIADKSTL